MRRCSAKNLAEGKKPHQLRRRYSSILFKHSRRSVIKVRRAGIDQIGDCSLRQLLSRHAKIGCNGFKLLGLTRIEFDSDLHMGIVSLSRCLAKNVLMTPNRVSGDLLVCACTRKPHGFSRTKVAACEAW